MSVMDEYAALRCRVESGERSGSSEREQDDLLAQMDVLWRRMTREQRESLRAPRGHIPPPVDVPYLAVGTVLQPLPHPSISSSDSHTSSAASPEGVPPPTD